MQLNEHEQLYQAIAHLKEPYQEILVSYYFLDMSIKNIADITGLKLSNVKVLLYRGRKQLKEVLSNEKLS
ncbi:sigma-70 family RNA polymerase sigma factor [Enterococcus saccharolyticus]|uniref:RNA polymerase sigma factor n=1 Tax=Enterococcus saccharolyticus TaxID=41997 RepID=UPI00316AED5C